MTLKELKARVVQGVMLRKVSGPPRKWDYSYDMLRVVVGSNSVGFSTEGEGITPGKGPGYLDWPKSKGFKDTGFGFILYDSRNGDMEFEWVEDDRPTLKDRVTRFMLNGLEHCEDRAEALLTLGDIIGNHGLASSVLEGWYGLTHELRRVYEMPTACDRGIREWLDCFSTWRAVTKDIIASSDVDNVHHELTIIS